MEIRIFFILGRQFCQREKGFYSVDSDVDFDSASYNVLFRRRPFCFVITIGVDTKTVDIEVTDEANWP